MGNPMPTTFDGRALRDVLGAFVTGVTVVTTVDGEGRPFGLTANSFSSVSLDPPLVLWSQSLKAPSYPVFRDAERFAISILAEHQSGVSQHFARGGPDKFAGVETERGRSGLPLIRDAAAYLECRRVTSYPGGDHAVFLGQVEHIAQGPHRPLAFGHGRYLITSPHDLGAFSLDLGVSGPGHLHALRLATPVAAELAAALQETVAVAVWGNMGPTVVRWEESPRPVSPNLRTGVVLPVLGSATGLAFAAFLPKELTADAIAAELAQRRSPPDTPEGVERASERIRQLGVATVSESRDSFAGMYETPISAISVPVMDRSGAMVLALTVVGPGARLDVPPDGPVTRALKGAAASLSGRLGFRQPRETPTHSK